MAKFVAKVAGITLYLLITAFTFIWLIMALFCPRPMCKIYKNINNYDMAMHYAAVAYKKTQAIEDLVEVANLSIRNKNKTFILNYTQKLITESNFKTYCLGINNGLDYYDFIASQYITEVYKTNKFYITWMVAEAFRYSDNYRNGSAIRSLLATAIEYQDVLTIQEYISVAKRWKDYYSGEALDRCVSDISRMETFLNEKSSKKLT